MKTFNPILVGSIKNTYENVLVLFGLVTKYDVCCPSLFLP